MQYVLGNMLNGGGGLNADGLSLDLQFAADKTLTARRGPTPVFTRASSATFIGSDGLIQSAAINTPRFDHDPVTLACKGLLIEESRTNLLSRSEDFANSTWNKSNSSISGTLYTAPTGASTANELVEDSLNAAHTCAQNAATATIGTTYTFSVFVKRKPSSNQFLLIGATNLVVASFLSVNLTNGVTSTGIGSPGAPINVSSTAYPNGWYRVQFSVVATSAAATTLDIRLSRDGTWTNRSYLGDGVQSSLIWGAQVEAGSFPTSYIPTTTGSLTRSADVCSYSDVSSFYNPAAGTLVGDLILYTPSTSSTPELFRFGAGNNRIQLGVTSVATEAIRPFIISGGTTTYNSTQGTIVAGTSRKVALTFATNDAISCLNGTLGTQDTSVTMPVSISTATIGTSSFTGHIAAIRYYRKRLPNAKLQALTA
jgi:hypothetical protein